MLLWRLVRLGSLSSQIDVESKLYVDEANRSLSDGQKDRQMDSWMNTQTVIQLAYGKIGRDRQTD